MAYWRVMLGWLWVLLFWLRRAGRLILVALYFVTTQVKVLCKAIMFMFWA